MLQNLSLELEKDKLFENIFSFAKEGIAIVSLSGEWIKVNKSVADILGYTESELYEMTFRELTHKDDLELDLSQMQALLAGSIDDYCMEKRYFHNKGHIVWCKLSVSLVRSDDQKPLYFISQISDITERKSNDEKLELMLAVAEKQKNRLSNFADIITHNLKTHATNLTTLVSFLEEEANDLDDIEDFMFLKESVFNLGETVSHLSKIAKIKSLELNEIEALNVNSYANQAMYNVKALAKHIEATIVNNINPNHNIKAIPAYLDSIILNFLTNAIKYASKKRKLKVSMSSRLKGDCVILDISDNGLGIDLDKYGEKLFEMYKTFHRHKDAVGLGLFITRNHVEALGGCIEVDSKVDQGTTFSVHFKNAEC